MNKALKKLNLETNYLSGDFFARLFKAALVNETLEEIKAGVSFATVAEKEIIDSIVANKGLTKVSITLRLPEGRHKVENATLRNGEYSKILVHILHNNTVIFASSVFNSERVLRREAALKAKREAEELAKNPVPHLPKEPKKEVKAKKPVVAAAKKEKEIPANDVKPVAPKPVTSPIKNNQAPIKPISSQITNPTIASAAKEKPKEEIANDKVPRKAIVPRKKVEEPKEPASPDRKLSDRVSMLARRLSDVDSSYTPVIRLGGEEKNPKKPAPVLGKKPGFLPDEEDLKAMQSAKKIPEKDIVPTPVTRLSGEEEVPKAPVSGKKPGFLPDEEDLKAMQAVQKIPEKE
ncbi:unnamed protein product, partial [Strongylus vulgaris]